MAILLGMGKEGLRDGLPFKRLRSVSCVLMVSSFVQWSVRLIADVDASCLQGGNLLVAGLSAERVVCQVYLIAFT